MKNLRATVSIALLALLPSLGSTAFGQDVQATGATTTPPATNPTTTPSPNGQPPTQKPATDVRGIVTTPTKADVTTTNNDEMTPIVVTGSYIPTTAGEVGPTPVDYVTDDAITKTDGNNLYDAIKRLNPGFQGGSNFGQELNNNSQTAGESQLELRNLPTLILLDGNRLTDSPLSTGEYVNLNLIPLSFVDHVEILKDGASTLYGSDAVSGVVNVITRKNFSGVEVHEQYGVGTDGGNFYSEKASVVGGITTDTSSVFAGVEYTSNNAIKSTDRPIASLSQAQIAAMGGGALPTYFSSNYPNVSGLGTKGTLIYGGQPLAKGAPGSFTGGTPAPIPGITTETPTEQDASLAADGYIPVSTLPTAVDGVFRLNTTQFGTYSFTPQEREQAFGNFNQDLYKQTVQIFGTFLYSHAQAESNLAPQPAPLTADGVVVPEDNPFNPFGVPIDGSNGISIKYRFIDAGDRTSTQTDNYYHFLAGLKGDFGIGDAGASKDYHYSATFGYDQEQSSLVNNNYINTSILQEALDGDDPAAPGLFYNPFSNPLSNSKTLTDSFKDNELQIGTADLMEIRVDLSATPAQLTLPGGPIGFGAGAEYRVESLNTIVDGVTSTGGQLGANATNNFPTQQRITGAAYLETNIPIVGPSMRIPGIHSFSVDASGRFEGIENGASSEIFRIAGSWQPYDDELTVRANFSQSFVAPTLYALYGPAVQTFAGVNLPGGGGEPAGGYQEAFNEESGPTPNSTAQNYGLGFVYSPKQIKGLTVSADYYNVIYDTPTDGSFQSIVNSINALGAASPYAKNAHTETPITTDAPNQLFDANFASLDVFPTAVDTTQKTQGIDMNILYVLPWTKYGVFTVGAAATYVFDFYGQDSAGGSFTNYAGNYADPGNVGGGAQGLIPQWQINPYFEYQWGGFEFDLSAQYIPRITDLGDSEPATSPFNDYSANGEPYPTTDYYNLDTQVSYEFGAKPPGTTGTDNLSRSGAWYDTTKFTFGVNNVTDTQPVYIPSSSEDNTAKSAYDIIGRFVYFQVTKKF